MRSTAPARVPASHQEARGQQLAVERDASAVVVRVPVLQARVHEAHVVERVVEQVPGPRTEGPEPAGDVVLVRQQRLVQLVLRSA